MAKKAKEKENEGMEVIQDPDALVERFNRTEEFLNKNRNAVFIGIGVLIVGLGLFFFLRQQWEEAYQEAEVQVYETEYLFEGDSISHAKDGFLYITEEYGRTKTGNRSHFALGVIYLHEGDYESAVASLKKFSSKDAILQGRAYSLLGDAYMELGEYDDAVKYYKKATEYKPNQHYTPVYLLKLGHALEMAEDYAGAIENYEYLTQKYPNAYQQVNEAKKYKALLEAKQTNG